MLPNWLKDHVKSCREQLNVLCKMSLFMKTSRKSLQQNLFPILCFLLHWKIFSVPSLSIISLNPILSYSIGYALANRNTKGPMAMQKHLLAERALTGC